MSEKLKKLLNPQQYEAVTSIEGPLLILAGAGTGKTRVITYRIAYMISRNIVPDSILAVTFTNKAAREMQERLKTLIGTGKKKPFISTFHSLGLFILRESIHHLGYRNQFSIYDESDQISLIKKVINDVWPHLTDKINVQLTRTTLSKYKDGMIDPETAANEAKSPEEVVYSSIYKEYQRRMKLYNALDFDDLILLPLQLFQNHPAVLEKFQDRFKYIMIDEYQDTNYPQFLFTKNIADKYGNICVVGDDDQSIYGWRGADYRNILQFDRHFSNTKIIKLEQNYRSTKTILEAANSVIKNNSLRRDKKLWSAKLNDNPITLSVHTDARDEAESTVKTILDHKLRNNRRFHDYAIIMRTNHQTRLFEQELRKNKIPYILIGGTRFYDRKEVKDIIAYLKFILNPNDEVSLLRIINTPPRSIGMTTISTLNSYCQNNKISFIKAVSQIDSIPSIAKKTTQSIKEFMELIESYRHKMNNMTDSLTSIIENFIKDIFYEREVTRISENKNEIESRMENVYDLIEDIRYFEEHGSEDKSIRQYINQISLDQDDSSNRKEVADDTVTIITLHSCKGLEFPVVFMVGLEEGIIPHSRSVDENKGDISEERRLCYVGITRAQDELYLSYALGRSKYGNLEPSNPSRFLKEIPESLIVNADEIYSTEDESQIAQFYLDKIKSIVNS